MTDLVSQLVGALNRLYVAAPTGLECNSFHHSKGEFHSHSEPCKPAAEYVEALAQARAALTAAKAGGWVAVPVQVLEDASEAIGNFVSDHGWGDSDMQAMDNLDAYIATHKARTAPPAQRGEG